MIYIRITAFILSLFALLASLCGCVNGASCDCSPQTTCVHTTSPVVTPSPSPIQSCTCSPTQTPSLTEAPESEYAGIDVSFYQGDIDFEKVKASGIEAVYIRAGEGSSITDDMFESNYEKASAAGMKLGFYYYVTARDTDEAESQAKRFAELISGKSYQFRPAMDFESFDGMSADKVNAIALAFLQTLELQTGVTPAIYSDLYAVETLWYDALNVYPLWIAEYGQSGDEPKSTGSWKAWSGYQYADDGSVDGISVVVDLDRFKSALLIDD